MKLPTTNREIMYCNLKMHIFFEMAAKISKELEVLNKALIDEFPDIDIYELNIMKTSTFGPAQLVISYTNRNKINSGESGTFSLDSELNSELYSCRHKVSWFYRYLETSSINYEDRYKHFKNLNFEDCFKHILKNIRMDILRKKLDVTLEEL